jgi:hypothetical protein
MNVQSKNSVKAGKGGSEAEINDGFKDGRKKFMRQ